MKGSVTYQAIVEEGVAKGRAEGRAEGRVQEARRLLLLLGRERFGEPGSGTLARLEAIRDLDHLEALWPRLFNASTWDDLLAPY